MLGKSRLEAGGEGERKEGSNTEEGAFRLSGTGAHLGDQVRQGVGIELGQDGLAQILPKILGGAGVASGAACLVEAAVSQFDPVFQGPYQLAQEDLFRADCEAVSAVRPPFAPEVTALCEYAADLFQVFEGDVLLHSDGVERNGVRALLLGPGDAYKHAQAVAGPCGKPHFPTSR